MKAGTIVAAALARTRMATSIKPKRWTAHAALRLAATDIAASLAHADPSFDREQFMREVGLS